MKIKKTKKTFRRISVAGQLLSDDDNDEDEEADNSMMEEEEDSDRSDEEEAKTQDERGGTETSASLSEDVFQRTNEAIDRCLASHGIGSDSETDQLSFLTVLERASSSSLVTIESESMVEHMSKELLSFFQTEILEILQHSLLSSHSSTLEVVLSKPDRQLLSLWMTFQRELIHICDVIPTATLDPSSLWMKLFNQVLLSYTYSFLPVIQKAIDPMMKDLKKVLKVIHELDTDQKEIREDDWIRIEKILLYSMTERREGETVSSLETSSILQSVVEIHHFVEILAQIWNESDENDEEEEEGRGRRGNGRNSQIFRKNDPQKRKEQKNRLRLAEEKFQKFENLWFEAFNLFIQLLFHQQVITNKKEEGACLPLLTVAEKTRVILISWRQSRYWEEYASFLTTEDMTISELLESLMNNPVSDLPWRRKLTSKREKANLTGKNSSNSGSGNNNQKKKKKKASSLPFKSRNPVIEVWRTEDNEIEDDYSDLDDFLVFDEEMEDEEDDEEDI